jgi:hypothetical protein
VFAGIHSDFGGVWRESVARAMFYLLLLALLSLCQAARSLRSAETRVKCFALSE